MVARSSVEIALGPRRLSPACARTHARPLALADRISNNFGVSEHPRCAAILQGGKQCRSVAETGSEFCEHHNNVVAEHGAEAVKRGEHLPARRNRVVQAAVVAKEAVPTMRNGSGAVDPASVRPRLAEAAAESVEDIRRVLLETATGANKNLWATINCKHCGRPGRYEITVPDNKVRLDAIQALLHESLGRPGQAEAQPAPALPATAEQARALSWDQMTLVFASQFAEEIGSVLDAATGSSASGSPRSALTSVTPCATHSPSPSSSDQELLAAATALMLSGSRAPASPCRRRRRCAHGRCIRARSDPRPASVERFRKSTSANHRRRSRKFGAIPVAASSCPAA
jgi:hypothetical protein